MRFTSKILPPFLRRVPSLDALIPVLYLKGISTGDFSEALASILGSDAPGLSASNIVRLKEGWEQEYRAWNNRDLTGKRYVYVWADGLYFNVRLNRDRPCILVLMGATQDGTKELLAVWDGERESKFGCTQQQRCWVHKTANILDKMPRSVQPDAKKLIHEMYLAPTRVDARSAYDAFVARYSAKYPKAVTCLTKDHDVLFTFYSFPAEHWRHLRTTNPIEPTFATVRHRTRQTKGCGSRTATMAMVYKLAIEAQKHWRRLNGHVLLLKVIEGVPFVNGEIEDIAA